MRTSTELAWAAGLFEGEGSVRIAKPGTRNWGILVVDLPNTDEEIVQFFASRWPGRVTSYPASGRRRAYWRWRIAARRAAVFLTDIRPYIVTERVAAKIDHGIAFQAQKRIGIRSDQAYCEQQWNAYWWMAHLNVRGVRPPEVEFSW